MALTATVTKVWPSFNSTNSILSVGVEIVVYDNAVEVKRATFTEATSKTGDPAVLATVIALRSQEMINAYKTEKQVYNHVKYEALRANVASALIL